MIFERRSSRRVLREYPDFARVHRYAEEHSFAPKSEQLGDEDAGIGYEMSWFLTPTVILVYAEDEVSKSSYLYVTGRDAADIEARIAATSHDLDPLTMNELSAAVGEAGDGPTLARALLRVGLGAPLEFDGAVFDLVCGGLSNEDEMVRQSTVYAMSYSPWLEWLPVLREVARSDSSADVRELAAMMAEQLETMDRDES
jgi:hypothetical protein